MHDNFETTQVYSELEGCIFAKHILYIDVVKLFMI